MKPLVEYGDPERALIDYLDGAYVGSFAARKPDTIDSRAPQATLAADQDWLQIELDGSFSDDEPVTERATVRFAYHTAPGKRSNAKAGASLAAALVRIHPGDASLYGTTPLVGRSGVITDPDTKNLMCWFTYRVNMRPIPVSA